VPSHLVPSLFVAVNEWPRLPSGKIDRRALAAIEAEAKTGNGGDKNFVAPRDADERALAAIWAGVLGVAQVGATDDFFSLGGHSLSAMQVMARVRKELKIELPVRALFDASTLESFARAVAAKREPEMEETTL
jgi:acyl carrier protein